MGGLHIDDKIIGLSISQWLPCPLCHLELVVWDGNLVKTTCDRATDFSVEKTGIQNHLLLFRFENLGNFVHPTLPVSFGRDTKSRCRWSFLAGVYSYVRGSK